jgi:hypothetical protein
LGRSAECHDNPEVQQQIQRLAESRSNTPLHRAAILNYRIGSDRSEYAGGPVDSDLDEDFEAVAISINGGRSGRVVGRGSRLIVIRSGLSLIYRGFTRFGDEARVGGAPVDRV